MRRRETEHEQGRGRERGRHRIRSRLQAPNCQHRARCRAQTHELWDHDLSWSQTPNWLSHPGSPERLHFKRKVPSQVSHLNSLALKLGPTVAPHKEQQACSWLLPGSTWWGFNLILGGEEKKGKEHLLTAKSCLLWPPCLYFWLCAFFFSLNNAIES